MGNRLVLGVRVANCFYSGLHIAGPTPTKDDLAIAYTYRTSVISARAGEGEYYPPNRPQCAKMLAAVAPPWFNEAMRSIVAPLEDSIAQVNTKMDQMNTRMNQMNTKITDVNTRMDEMNTKIDEVKVELRESARTTNMVFNHRAPYKGA